MNATTRPREGSLIRPRLKFESEYTQIPNRWLRDKRLRRSARGLLAELMTHEPGYQVSIAVLIASGQEGRDAVRSSVLELERNGYLQRVERRKFGRYAGDVWELRDPFEAAGDPTADRLAGVDNLMDSVDNSVDNRAGRPEGLKKTPGHTVAGLPAPDNPAPVQPSTVNPTPIEELIKEDNYSLPSATTEALGQPVDNFGAVRWLDDRCPGNWRDGRHELGTHGACRHCHVRPSVQSAQGRVS